MPCPKAGHFKTAPETPVVSFRRSVAASGRAGLGWGKKSAVPTADPPLPATRYTLARRRFPCARTRFSHGKSGLEDAFHHSPKPLSQTFHIFSPHRLNNLRPRTPYSPQSVPYSGTGPRKRNLGGMTLVFLPLSATGISPGSWERYYVSQFRRLNHRENTLIGAPLACQPTAK